MDKFPGTNYTLADLLRAIYKIPLEHLYCRKCALRGSFCTCYPVQRARSEGRDA